MGWLAAVGWWATDSLIQYQPVAVVGTAQQAGWWSAHDDWMATAGVWPLSTGPAWVHPRPPPAPKPHLWASLTNVLVHTRQWTQRTGNDRGTACIGLWCMDRKQGWWECGQGASNPIEKNCGKLRENGGKSRCRNQTFRSLREQHVCTGETQGTNKHARSTSEKQLQKNCEKMRKIAKLRKIAEKCGKLRNCEKLRTSIAPPLQAMAMVGPASGCVQCSGFRADEGGHTRRGLPRSKERRWRIKRQACGRRTVWARPCNDVDRGAVNGQGAQGWAVAADFGVPTGGGRGGHGLGLGGPYFHNDGVSCCRVQLLGVNDWDGLPHHRRRDGNRQMLLRKRGAETGLQLECWRQCRTLTSCACAAPVLKEPPCPLPPSVRRCTEGYPSPTARHQCTEG